MEDIKNLKSTEKIIERLSVINEQLNTAERLRENKTQQSFKIVLLNEQMRLLVEFQRKQECYYDIKSNINLKDMSADTLTDLDEVTKALMYSYVTDTSASENLKKQKLVSIMNCLSNSNDILLLKLQ